MNWRPCTQIVTCLPFGGVGWVVEADRTTPGLEFGGLMMPLSLTKVTTVIATRIRAAATVHETSRVVLPWICGAPATALCRRPWLSIGGCPQTHARDRFARVEWHPSDRLGARHGGRRCACATAAPEPPSRRGAWERRACPGRALGRSATEPGSG